MCACLLARACVSVCLRVISVFHFMSSSQMILLLSHDYDSFALLARTIGKDSVIQPDAVSLTCDDFAI